MSGVGNFSGKGVICPGKCPRETERGIFWRKCPVIFRGRVEFSRGKFVPAVGK